MIDRYSRKQMKEIWTDQKKFESMLEVEKKLASVQARFKIIPEKAKKAILKKAKFNLKQIEKLEEKTKHDVIAFVENVSAHVGEYGTYVHFGLTSSDVLDTSLALRVKKASSVLMNSVKKLEIVLRKKIKEDRDLLCAGRTHGIHAELITYGVKWASFLSELKRNEKRLNRAFSEFSYGKLSGACGVYSSQKASVEKEVLKALGLKVEPVSTQVIPRDRHAEVFSSLSFLASFLQRLALEIRHLQRTEVSEVFESFSKNQKGSSAMPHKKNPIGSENITGCARLLHSYFISSQLNIPLWHERDISHSSVERVIFPDAFILCDYMCDRMSEIMKNLKMNKKQISKNIESSKGMLFSSQVLTKLVEKGMDRKKAYLLIQKHSHSLKEKDHLKIKLKKDPKIKKYLSLKEIEDIFKASYLKKNVKLIIDRTLKGEKSE